MSVRIYVEGGGSGHATKTRCREGFSKFVEKVLGTSRRPRIIACGSRNSAFKDFQTALQSYPDDFVMLLVDSEGPVADIGGPWSHLKARDNWERPILASDEHAHLMVQSMEAWFIADRPALVGYFGQGFIANALPAQPNIEAISKSDLEAALASATRNTRTKGAYHKTRHAFDLLARIDPDKVRRASPHAERLCSILVTRS